MRSFDRPPRFYRYFLALAAALVPSPQRAAWRSSQCSVLTALWTLIQRGEFPRNAETILAAFCREAARCAVFARFSPTQLLAAAGSPVLPFAVLTALLALTALITGGLPTLTRLCAEFRTATDFVFGHAFVLTLAGIIALHAMLSHPNAVHGWRSAAFLCAKTMLAMFTLACIWMESAAAVQRALLPREALWVASRLVSTFGFLFASGWLAGWCMSDQRNRCPSCLRRLALPISLGSRASVLDPATTILVCPEGHGSLAATEIDLSPQDQWTRMDASWGILATPIDKVAHSSS